MRNILLCFYLFANGLLSGQTISKGKYIPKESLFFGYTFLFNDEKNVDVNFFSCMSGQSGKGVYELKKGIMTVTFEAHPSDTFVPYSVVNFDDAAGIEKDSVTITLRTEEVFGKYTYRPWEMENIVACEDTINFRNCKLTDSTISFKISTDKLPCKMVSIYNSCQLETIIQSPFPINIVNHISLFSSFNGYFKAGDKIIFNIDKVTKTGFEIVLDDSKKKRRIHYIRSEEN